MSAKDVGGIMNTQTNNHAKFLSHLDSSIDTMFIAARFLYANGYTVKINKMSKAESHNDWEKHADTGDLTIWIEEEGKAVTEERIEVKGLSIDFTNESDWKYKDFIVCASHSWDRSLIKPYAYMIFNRNKTHCAIVLGRDSDKWTIGKRVDTRYEGIEQQFYFSPFEHVKWKVLPQKA
tara:strand:+ start:411 stop:944 length:534 start_codon:yes stop_codon:yes gene_type:complete